MRDLRLIGVHDDGEHLVVVDDAGQEHRLRIDEPLRAAVRRDRPRLGQLQIEIDSDIRPREVQAMIRAGADAEEVAARTGWSLDKIARFEGPVLAEREHIAGAAQRVRLRGPSGAGSQETLGGRSAGRLASRGVMAESVRWDSARDADGQWTVTAAFTAGGKERRATWWFDTHGMSVVPKNDEAKWLSEADTPDGVVPTPHRPTTVFDVEADGTSGARGPDELMTTMRETSAARGRRRSRRKGHVEPPLPLEGTGSPSPQESPSSAGAAPQTPPKPESAGSTARPDEAVTPSTPTPDVAPAPGVDPTLPPAARGTHPLDEVAEADGDVVDATPTEDTETPAEVETPADVEAPADVDEADAGADGAGTVSPSEGGTPRATPSEGGTSEATPAAGPRTTPPRRKGRSSVPSWDDVMFGKKPGS